MLFMEHVTHRRNRRLNGRPSQRIRLSGWLCGSVSIFRGWQAFWLLSAVVFITAPIQPARTGTIGSRPSKNSKSPPFFPRINALYPFRASFFIPECLATGQGGVKNRPRMHSATFLLRSMRLTAVPQRDCAQWEFNNS